MYSPICFLSCNNKQQFWSRELWILLIIKVIALSTPETFGYFLVQMEFRDVMDGFQSIIVGLAGWVTRISWWDFKM